MNDFPVCFLREKMKHIPVKPNPNDYPEAAAKYLRGSAVFDSSCSPEARVLLIDRDEGFFLKTAAEGTLRTEARMTAYLHTLGLSAEVLYCGASRGRDYLLTRRLPGGDCTEARYLSDPKRLCDTTAALLRALHETDAKDCPVDRIPSFTAAVTAGFDGRHYEPELFRGMWEFPSFADAGRAA